MTKAKWYFDFISPFAYLQLARFSQLPADLDITPVPVVFSALLKHWGQLGPAEIPPKRRFVYRFFNGMRISWVFRSRCHRDIRTTLCRRSDCALPPAGKSIM